ncbi:MAG: hypothetical protein OHK0046_38790 [Anaerolineae bacterium]
MTRKILILGAGLMLMLTFDVSAQLTYDCDWQPDLLVEQNADWIPCEQNLNDTTMVLVPPGAFQMGSTEEEVLYAHTLLAQYWFSNANPPEEMTFYDSELTTETSVQQIIAPYWIDKYEVSNRQYRQCILVGLCAPAITYPPDNDDPIRAIPFNQVVDYCTWRGGHLPTEIEWEYAARGPSRLIFPYGNEFDASNVNFCDENCEQTWSDRELDDGFEDVAPVDHYSSGASWIGAYNMAGNVSEWTRSQSVPDTGSDQHIIRGGSFNDSPDRLRTAWRGLVFASSRNRDLGFRCVYPFDVIDQGIIDLQELPQVTIQSFEVDDPVATAGDTIIVSWQVEGIETVNIELHGFVSYQQPQIRPIAVFDNLPVRGTQTLTMPEVPATVHLIIDPRINPSFVPNRTIQLTPSH